MLIFVLALTSLGIMVIGSAKHSVQGKQMIGLLIGLVALVIVSLIDYMWILNLQWVLYGLTIAMLLAVRFFGKDVNGATRWIDFGFTTFQPSELAKILLVLFFAKFIMNHQDEMKKPLTIIQAVIFLAIPCLLIYKQPDLSTTISIAMVFCIMMYYSIILALLVVAGIICMTIAARAITSRSSKYFLRQQVTIANAEAFMEEMMTGQKVIKVFCHEDGAKADFDKVNGEYLFQCPQRQPLCQHFDASAE